MKFPFYQYAYKLKQNTHRWTTHWRLIRPFRWNFRFRYFHVRYAIAVSVSVSVCIILYIIIYVYLYCCSNHCCYKLLCHLRIATNKCKLKRVNKLCMVNEEARWNDTNKHARHGKERRRKSRNVVLLKIRIPMIYI